MRKLQQFYIIKIEANKILSNDFDITLSLYDARKTHEVVEIADGQVLRTIRKICGRETDFAYLDSLISEKQSLKRKIKKNESKELIERFKQVISDIDKILFIPEYISIVSDDKTQYNKIRKNGFNFNGKHYRRFMCSASNARHNTAFFIQEDIYKTANNILKNGHNKVKMAEAKYNAYFSLTSSATHIVSNPKVVVVPDKEIKRKEVIDWVDFNEGGNYDVTRKECDIGFNLWDGMGIISPKQAKIWADELLLDYIPGGYLIRAPFIKGMVFTFDFHKFAYEIATNKIITDIWGEKHHVDDVEVILSQSQFKLWNGYNNWEQYTNNLQLNDLNWGVAKVTPKEDKNYVRTNYQFIQVLNIKDREIDKLCKPTVDWFKYILGGDDNYIKLYLLGSLAEKDDILSVWDNIQDPFLKAMLINSDVKQDRYIQDKINQSIQKRVKESYIGKILIKGNFQMMISDPYAFCEHIFGLEIKGLLQKGEYYSDYWNKKDVKTIAGMRSPLTWRSEVNKMNLIQNENINEWYKYYNSGIVYNVFDYDCLIHAGSDFDGDIVCTTDNEVFINNQYGGVPVLGVHDSPKKHIIKNYNLAKYDSKAFNTKIGHITNCATTISEMLSKYEEGTPQYKELIRRLKLCCHFQSLQIDSAKGIKVQPFPKNWTRKLKIKEEMTEDEIHAIELSNELVIRKRPKFMRHLYSNYNKEYKDHIENYNSYCKYKFGCEISDINEKIKQMDGFKDFEDNFNKYNPLLETHGVMNSVCEYMEKNCKDIKLQLKNSTNEKFFELYMNKNYVIDNDLLKQVQDKYQQYMYYKKNKFLIDDSGNFQKYCENLKFEMDFITFDEDELTTLAVYVCYVLNPKKSKDFAWDICGNGIVNNIIRNSKDNRIKIPLKDNNGTIEYLGSKYEIKTEDFNNDNI